MFSKETSLKISKLLSKEAQDEILLLMDDLISQQIKNIKENSTDEALRIIAIKIDFFEKFKDYRKYLEDVINYGRN